MRKIYLVVVTMLVLCSCSTDKDVLDIENESIELAAKSSSDNVKLLRAWTSNSSSPVRRRYVRRFAVKVKNIAFQKEVAIHHLTNDGVWVDIPLVFQQSIANDEEVWIGEVTPETESYADQFVVKYKVNGQTYWDNNNGANYSMLVNMGAYLAPNIELSVDTFYTRFYGNNFNINVDARRNYGAPGTIEVVYTTDGWVTTKRAALSYQRYFRVGYAHYIQSPNQFDIDKWETSVSVDSNIDTIEYAVVYTVNDQEYWDNNHGKNYTITKQN